MLPINNKCKHNRHGCRDIVKPICTSCHTLCRMSRRTFAQASVICVLDFSSVLDNRPIQTLTNRKKKKIMSVSCCDIRRYSIGPPRPNHWLGRSSCWYDRTSLWVCDYVQLHGKSYLEHLPALVALNSPLGFEIKILWHSQIKFHLAELLV
jgi:hypothetical protein